MAYKVIILYQLYMPSYFLGTFTEYPSLNSGIPGRTFCPNIGYLYDSLVRPNLPDEKIR